MRVFRKNCLKKLPAIKALNTEYAELLAEKKSDAPAMPAMPAGGMGGMM